MNTYSATSHTAASLFGVASPRFISWPKKGIEFHLRPAVPSWKISWLATEQRLEVWIKLVLGCIANICQYGPILREELQLGLSLPFQRFYIQ